MNELKFIDSFSITWSGVDLSLNKWYANRHWSFRNKEKEFWKNFFIKITPRKMKLIDQYFIVMSFNSRLDASNTIPMIKIYEDTLKEYDYIIDDSRKFCKGLQILTDDSLDKKTYIITINVISYAKSEAVGQYRKSNKLDRKKAK